MSGLSGCCSRNVGRTDEVVRMDMRCFTPGGDVLAHVESMGTGASCDAYFLRYGAE